nr:hypothetical protein GCM10025730_05690 [Promicromonospora thailandica]
MRDLLPHRGDYDLRPRTLGADLVAGLTVGVVALPWRSRSASARASVRPRAW